MKIKLVSIIILSVIFLSCRDKKESVTNQETASNFQNKGHELVVAMVAKVGDYKNLIEKKDVVYTYVYETPDGQKDVSTEKYIFKGELSYGAYRQHERTFPDLEGLIEQGYDGNNYWLKHKGQILTDTVRLKRVAFNRPTNFYWFAMFQKLLDPGLNYEFIGEKMLDDTAYDVVKISFQSNDDTPTDTYQLYINKQTMLVDQFLFTVADFGVLETPYLMQLQYEDIDGMLIPTKRQYKKSTWNADVSDNPWIHVTWSDIKFNNGLSKDDFKS